MKQSRAEMEVIFDITSCFLKVEKPYLGPLLLTWINFNPSVDK